jgi:hypothetical protein
VIKHLEDILEKEKEENTEDLHHVVMTEEIDMVTETEIEVTTEVMIEGMIEETDMVTETEDMTETEIEVVMTEKEVDMTEKEEMNSTEKEIIHLTEETLTKRDIHLKMKIQRNLTLMNIIKNKKCLFFLVWQKFVCEF